MAAAAVDGEFGCIYASFELNLKCPGMLSGPHCVPFVGTLGSLGAHFGPPGAASGRPGSALELLWGCLGTILGLIGKKMLKVSAGSPIASRWLSTTAPAHKNRPAGIHVRIPRVPKVPAKWFANYSSGPSFHASGIRMT